MPNYYYIDPNGEKQGLITEHQLQALATQGIITPATPLETDGGHQGVAGQIPGLNFNAAASPPQMTNLQRVAGAPDRIFSWLDWTFQDIRLPKNIRRVCGFIYLYLFVIVLCIGILFTMEMFSFIGEMSIFLFVLYISLCWMFVAFIVAVARLACELLIVLMNWIVETKLYIDDRKNERK